MPALFSSDVLRWRPAARGRPARQVAGQALLAALLTLGLLAAAGTSAMAAAPEDASISIAASVSPTEFTTNRTALTFTFVVTNTGTVPLTNVRVESFTAWYGLYTTCPRSTLDPGASMNCTAPYSASGRDFTLNQVFGAGQATGQPPSGPAVFSTWESARAYRSLFNDDIDLQKSAAQYRFTAAGQRLDYSYRITNNTDAPLTEVTVHDSYPGLSPVHCPTTTLAAGARIICTVSYLTTEEDVIRGQVSNYAYVSGVTPSGATYFSITQSVIVSKIGTSGLTVAKAVAPATFRGAGETLTYQYLLTNTGTFNALTNIAVLDPHPGTSPVRCAGTDLAPSESMICTATYVTTCADVAAGSITDIAAATATIEFGPQIASLPATATASYRPVLDVTRPFPPICLPVVHLPPVTVGPFPFPSIALPPWTIGNPAALALG